MEGEKVPTHVDNLLSHTVALAGALTAGVGKAPYFATEAAKDSEGGSNAASSQLREQIRALAADVTAASAAIDKAADAVADAEHGEASKAAHLSEIAALQREHEKATAELQLAGKAALSSLRGLRDVQRIALGGYIQHGQRSSSCRRIRRSARTCTPSSHPKPSLTDTTTLQS